MSKSFTGKSEAMPPIPETDEEFVKRHQLNKIKPEGVGEWEIKKVTFEDDDREFVLLLDVEQFILQEKAKWKGEGNWNKHKIMEWSNENSIRAYKVYDEDPNVWVIKVEDLQKRIDKLI